MCARPPMSAAYFDPAVINTMSSIHVDPGRVLSFCRLYGEPQERSFVDADPARRDVRLHASSLEFFCPDIRARDEGKPCISCGQQLPSAQVGGGFDCGHYRSVGSAPHMRFVEDNAHGQCKYCNRHMAGNHVEYRKSLIHRIGIRAVDLIEADTTVRKYTRDGLIEIARHYRAEARRLKGA